VECGGFDENFIFPAVIFLRWGFLAIDKISSHELSFDEHLSKVSLTRLLL
jgi:hypothetical protein